MSMRRFIVVSVVVFAMAIVSLGLIATSFNQAMNTGIRTTGADRTSSHDNTVSLKLSLTETFPGDDGVYRTFFQEVKDQFANSRFTKIVDSDADVIVDAHFGYKSHPINEYVESFHSDLILYFWDANGKALIGYVNSSGSGGRSTDRTWATAIKSELSVLNTIAFIRDNDVLRMEMPSANGMLITLARGDSKPIGRVVVDFGSDRSAELRSGYKPFENDVYEALKNAGWEIAQRG